MGEDRPVVAVVLKSSHDILLHELIQLGGGAGHREGGRLLQKNAPCRSVYTCTCTHTCAHKINEYLVTRVHICYHVCIVYYYMSIVHCVS